MFSIVEPVEIDTRATFHGSALRMLRDEIANWQAETKVEAARNRNDSEHLFSLYVGEAFDLMVSRRGAFMNVQDLDQICEAYEGKGAMPLKNKVLDMDRINIDTGLVLHGRNRLNTFVMAVQMIVQNQLPKYIQDVGEKIAAPRFGTEEHDRCVYGFISKAEAFARRTPNAWVDQVARVDIDRLYAQSFHSFAVKHRPLQGARLLELFWGDVETRARKANLSADNAMRYTPVNFLHYFNAGRVQRAASRPGVA